MDHPQNKNQPLPQKTPKFANGCSVLVFNVHPNTPEQLLCDLFSSVGPLQQFRLINEPLERDSTPSRPCALAVYASPEVAAVAVNHLNEHRLDSRKLRVVLATQGTDSQSSFDLLSLSLSQPLQETGGHCNVFNGGITRPNLLEIISNIKLHAMSRPDVAKAMLVENPLFTHSFFNHLLACGLIDPSAVQRFLRSSNLLKSDFQRRHSSSKQSSSQYDNRGFLPPNGDRSLRNNFSKTQSTQKKRQNQNQSEIHSSKQQRNQKSADIASLTYQWSSQTPTTKENLEMRNPEQINIALANIPEQQRMILRRIFDLTDAQFDALPSEQKHAINQLKIQFPQISHLLPCGKEFVQD